MTLFSKAFASLSAAVLGLLLPVISFAQETITLNGKDAWDLFTYGNGEALAEVLTSVTLMMAPDYGGGAYRYILLLMATIGFFVMAVQAGFSPRQNFSRMMGFIILVFFVQYGTTGARVNVHVYDRGMNFSTVVEGVPAIVGVPASVLSQLGEWLTRQVEQNFSIPGPLKVSESGQFDLFGRVMKDLDNYVITSPDIKRSLSAYTADCVVPAMALGKLSSGELLKSQNLLETLGAAQHNAISTRYFPQTGANGQPARLCEHVPAGTTYATNLGVLMSCSQAYSCLSEDLETYAEVLMNATGEQWSTTGVMVPYEAAMSAALSQAAAAGSPNAHYSRPQGLILQKALINSMGGAFRAAAAKTGNNELMTATAIAQAEQSQKSAWWTAAEIFQNMMGYVYLVLQAFIFAVVPVVVVGLLVPGLGSRLGTNYFQVLTWLTLWMPMLAIVNFLITVFGGQQMRYTLENIGLSMLNSGAVSEYSNNIVIAAQFLGTMVPLITWGLVKGAMAFTEFISHGVGSSFATQAGAQASTGNVSMGNLSMDNVGMDKYSTQATSAVGMQAVQSSFGAGQSLGTIDMGGTRKTASGQAETVVRSRQAKYALSDTERSGVGMSLSQAQSVMDSLQTGTADLVQKAKSIDELINRAQDFASKNDVTSSEELSARRELAEKAAAALEAMRAASTAVSAEVKIGFQMGGGVGAEFKEANQQVEKAMQDLSAAYSRAYALSNKGSESSSHGDSIQNTDAYKEGASWNDSISKTHSQADSVMEQMGRQAQYVSDLGFSVEYSQSESTSLAYADAGRAGEAMDYVPNEIAKGGAQIFTDRESFREATPSPTEVEHFQDANRAHIADQDRWINVAADGAMLSKPNWQSERDRREAFFDMDRQAVTREGQEIEAASMHHQDQVETARKDASGLGLLDIFGGGVIDDDFSPTDGRPKMDGDAYRRVRFGH